MKNAHPERETATRQRVFFLIVSSGSQTASGLANALDLTPAAVRRHLTALLDDGLIKARAAYPRPARGRGRPAKTFVLTDTGRARIPAGYSRLALEAIRALDAESGASSVDVLATVFLAPVEERFQQIQAADPTTSKVQALVAAFAEGGFVASVSATRGGEQLCLHNCPIVDVARAFPQFCEAETSMVSRLLNSHVQRLASIARGDGICTTNVPHVPHKTGTE